MLASLIEQMFPQARIGQVGIDRLGYFCEFTYSGSFDTSVLEMVERELKSLVKTAEPFKLYEMVPVCAKVFLERYGKDDLASMVPGGKAPLQVIQLNSYCSIPQEPLTEGDFSNFVSLLSFSQENEMVRMHGVAHNTQEEQKAFLKAYRNYQNHSHQTIAEEMNLYSVTPQGTFWHPKGVLLKQRLLEKWRAFLCDRGFEEVEIPIGLEKNYLKETTRKAIFSLREGKRDWVFSDNLFTSLQTLSEFTKIFDVETKWILISSGPKKEVSKLKQALKLSKIEAEVIEEGGWNPRIEARFIDSLGRLWEGPQIELRKEGIFFSLFGEVDRLIALLLEKGLPFWLSPEQAHLISFEGADAKELTEILEELNVRFKHDQKRAPLKEKIHRALRMKVPYVIVFGRQEEKEKEISIRTYGSKRENKMKIEDLKHFLLSRKTEV